MRASAIEFRFRMVINSIIIVLGFWAPWIEAWGIGRRVSLIEWLSIELSRLGIASFSSATSLLVAIALLFAAAGVVFRVWGTAYLGPGTVNSASMVAAHMVADGPYRFVRNPLYIGLVAMVSAMAFLMPAGGAVFSVGLIVVFAVRLALGEEAFLSAAVGEPYRAYTREVPRFIPRLRGAPAPSGTKPHWARAAFAELTPIGILVALVVFARNYEIALAGRIILVFFGTSLVVRALVSGPGVSSAPAK